METFPSPSTLAVETSILPTVELRIDGGFDPARCIGSWAVNLRSADGREMTVQDAAGGCVTHNQALLQAVLAGLQRLKLNMPRHVIIVTNAQYIVDGVNRDLPRWTANGWRRTCGRKAVNAPQWRFIVEAAAGHVLEARYAKEGELDAAHTGRRRALQKVSP